MQIRDIMTDKIIAVSQHEPIASAARLMKRHNLGALPVCDDEGRLRGILTDRDIVVRCVAADIDPTDIKVREIMSRGVTVCGAQEDVDTAARAMGKSQVRRIPVLEDGKLVGMVSLCDLSRSSRYSMEAAQALGEISANIQRR